MTNNKVMCDVLTHSCCFSFGLAGTLRNSRLQSVAVEILWIPIDMFCSHMVASRLQTLTMFQKGTQTKEWIVRRNLMLSDFAWQMLILVPVT